MKINDRPGFMTSAVVRKYFESAVKRTNKLRATLSLHAIEKGGAFCYYADPDTNAVWLGFQMGFRVAETLVHIPVVTDVLQEQGPTPQQPPLPPGKNQPAANDGFRLLEEMRVPTCLTPNPTSADQLALQLGGRLG